MKALILVFIRHKVAANLLMICLILAGLWGVRKLNVQFLPHFEIPFIEVSIHWPGANSEEVAKSITEIVAQHLQSLDNVKDIYGISSQSNSRLFLEMRSDANLNTAVEQVRDRVQQIRNLPSAAQTPIIERISHFEPISKLLLTGPVSRDELYSLAHQIKQRLLASGIAKVSLLGLPDEELVIQVSNQFLYQSQQTLQQLGTQLAQQSKNIPSGKTGQYDQEKKIRTLGQRYQVKEFLSIPLLRNTQGQWLTVADIADVSKRAKPDEPLLFFGDNPAVEITLFRTGKANALQSANILNNFLANYSLPKTIQLKVYQENWTLIQERIYLLLKNGLGGLILILVILFLFLHYRVASWVAIAIPISFLAALFFLYFIGGSINMVSLFALIMTLGIVVDDTIVVAEEAMSQLSTKHTPLAACQQACYKMLAPIMASSLTTVCAFIPLLLIGNIIGQILIDIPLVVICVIFASLLECFLILPGHLFVSFTKHPPQKNNKRYALLRNRFDHAFIHFREEIFKPLLSYALKNGQQLLILVSCLFLLSLSLVITGHIPFNFFPSPDGTSLYANIQFAPGVDKHKKLAFLNQLENDLAILSKNKENPVILTTQLLHIADRGQEQNIKRGKRYAMLHVELKAADERAISNQAIINQWRQQIQLPSYVENISFNAPKAGPPGRDIDIRLYGNALPQLKRAALKLRNTLRHYQGILNIQDDTPYGSEQLIYRLNDRAKALGLTETSIGQQIKHAFSGYLAQIYTDNNRETEVRIMLKEKERYTIHQLESLNIVTNEGISLPLASLVDFTSQKGFDTLRHTNGNASITVTADVDPSINNRDKIEQDLRNQVLPGLAKDYQIQTHLGGRAQEQQETFADMKYGLVLALLLIYIVLAWVFSSYSWPIIILCTIPLGLTGAILGHLWMQIDITILSLFGFFGLAGIVINDSIILISHYQSIRDKFNCKKEAIIQASCDRLRAVLLTSLTTIAGLIPLLFETSMQAQFLIPMATSISFGLAFATLLILFVVPVQLYFYECNRCLK